MLIEALDNEKGSDSDSDLFGPDIEKKSKAIDAKKAVEEQLTNDEMLINIKEQDDDYRLLTPREFQEKAQGPPDLPALYRNWTTEVVRRLESWLIENHGFPPQYVEYAVSELNEKSFWKMFDAAQCRRKYGACRNLHERVLQV
ncbi:hypothetical protein AgCh_016584 [Apium graveolens]